MLKHLVFHIVLLEVSGCQPLPFLSSFSAIFLSRFQLGWGSGSTHLVLCHHTAIERFTSKASDPFGWIARIFAKQSWVCVCVFFNEFMFNFIILITHVWIYDDLLQVSYPIIYCIIVMFAWFLKDPWEHFEPVTFPMRGFLVRNMTTPSVDTVSRWT